MALLIDNPAFPGTKWANPLSTSGSSSKVSEYRRSAAITARYRLLKVTNWANALCWRTGFAGAAGGASRWARRGPLKAS
jgi:hypothetical protein